MDNELKVIGRSEGLFTNDITQLNQTLCEIIERSRFLVVGGAGSIGQAVVKEIFKRDPAKLHVVDISENNMVELVRDIRSTYSAERGEFKTFALDIGSDIFYSMLTAEGPYDYVFNLSALKHVRSEKDPFTLMRMLTVNVFHTEKIARWCEATGVRNYFVVSTDKAANPVNMMGASKRIMELFLLHGDIKQKISMARFANVAFSDGSLLHGFNQRFLKKQPLSAPNDVKRYFLTPQESGELCMLSGLLGERGEIFFPKLDSGSHMMTFSDIAIKFLQEKGLRPLLCGSESEARGCAEGAIANGQWPCYFFSSDTTGEKAYEEFYTGSEQLSFDRFSGVGVIKTPSQNMLEELEHFRSSISGYIKSGSWNKQQLVECFLDLVPEFTHEELGRNLDQRM